MTDHNQQLKDAGLKITSPRVKILDYLRQPECQHISAEDLYKLLLDNGEEIGLATVYRVLNQFDDAGIVTRHHFEGGKSVFELAQQHHHDHLVCLDCGSVVEFSDEVIEQRQKEIAAAHGKSSAQVILRVERNTHKAEVTVHVKGKDFFAEATDPADLYAAIDFMVDKLDRQVRKHKEIVTDHHQPAAPAAQGE